ncbi:MAG: hypothetical protein O7E52_04490 [Candidatus Poribacteria bacterium]|nr:hypothetical protein [Candidatus Poribacteria bacterium]
MTNRALNLLIICCLYTIGCLGGTSEKTAAVDAMPAATAPAGIADLHLSLSKPIYSPDEPIPLEMKIHVGKFDLLVPYSAVESRGAFLKLAVKDALGRVVTPKHPITFPGQTKTLIRKGKAVRCVQGTELKASTVKNAVLENLRTYYELKPGDYTLQVLMGLKVYHKSLVDQSPEIIDIEREIALVQSDKNRPPDAKQEMIGLLRKEIERARIKEGDKLNQIFLPLDSYRGLAELKSNIIALTIQ